MPRFEHPVRNEADDLTCSLASLYLRLQRRVTLYRQSNSTDHRTLLALIGALKLIEDVDGRLTDLIESEAFWHIVKPADATEIEVSQKLGWPVDVHTSSDVAAD